MQLDGFGPCLSFVVSETISRVHPHFEFMLPAITHQRLLISLIVSGRRITLSRLAFLAATIGNNNKKNGEKVHSEKRETIQTLRMTLSGERDGLLVDLKRSPLRDYFIKLYLNGRRRSNR